MGCRVVRGMKAPFLNGEILDPFEVPPSAKIIGVLNPVGFPSTREPVFSISIILSLIISIDCLRASGDPPLGTKIHCKNLQKPPMNGKFSRCDPTIKLT